MARTGRDISLLFDLFTVSQRVGVLIAHALDGSGLRGDEYAVYSLLLELGPLTATEMSRHLGLPLSTVLDHLRVMESRDHIWRSRDPADGRARRVRLSIRGLAAQRKANRAWERMRVILEGALQPSIPSVRRSLQALDAATLAAQARLRAKRDPAVRGRPAIRGGWTQRADTR